MVLLSNIFHNKYILFFNTHYFIIILVCPFDPTRKSTHKNRWTDDGRAIILSSFQTVKNKKLRSFREINEIKITYRVLKARTQKCSDKNLIT